ncbi:MAG: 30S ribosomal protein S16 [Verrucomicrobiota bacterium]|nr:30S ribosomal protein S16 [Verrucomicrobiota bacterium]
MALIIRMRQQGANSRQRFRVVLTDVRYPRDGKYIEKLGWYNPFGPEGTNYQLDVPRIQYWIDQGAQVSDRVKSLVKRLAPEVVKQMGAKKVAKMEKARVQRKKEKAPAKPAKKAAAKKK